ncbi:extracellular solute-binding protein [Helicobacter sp. 13S00477-4]|uniref:extracellular solute-binding protein n=1 Tax=Helicobacter sp. 13S00477-4 TaxID=1905759 RepID=UPI000BA51670|nr:extracellular solute-binding protein [Helicobacter sp. 13S00477-4]PAF52848.1 hypothetical protein BKH44_01315 [Helicobacter sp. 13S00477-4]
MRFIFFIFIMLFLNACISQDQKSSSKTLTIYSAFENEEVKQYIDAFRQKYPDIKVEMIVASNGVLTARLLAEKSHPRADIIYGLSAMNMEELRDIGLLEAHYLAIEPAIKLDFQNPYYIGLNNVEGVILVNTKELQKKGLSTPLSFKDLTRAEYKGLITMPNPTFSGTGFVDVVGWISLWGRQKAFEYMKKLDKNIGIYTLSGSKPAYFATSGEYPIALSFSYRGLQIVKKNPMMKMIFPKEGSPADLESIALVKKQNENVNAKIFFQWAISQEAMRLYEKNNAHIAIKRSTPLPSGYRDVFPKVILIDFAKFARNRGEILDEWNKLFSNKSEGKQ